MIEEERLKLLKEKNKDSIEWRNKYEDMRKDHEEIVENLKEANSCYLA